MSFEYRPAIREKIGLLFGLSGASGSGKTMTAMLLASGIANGTGSIAVIDTEAGRSLHYAPRPGEKADPAKGTFNFNHIDFSPPFTPERYIEAIGFAAAKGATVIVVDSMSHEWAGEGGCADIQALEAERMAKRAAERNNRPWEALIDTMTAPAWKRPKIRHKRMVANLLQCRVHLIFCLRAEEKVKIDQKTRQIVPIGFQPICEKSFPFELSGSFMLNPARPGCPDYDMPNKLNADFRDIFPNGKIVGPEAGKRLRLWAESGSERRESDKISIGVSELIARIEDAGTMEALEAVISDDRVKQQSAYLRSNRPELFERLDEAIKSASAGFDAGGWSSTHESDDHPAPPDKELWPGIIDALGMLDKVDPKKWLSLVSGLHEAVPTAGDWEELRGHPSFAKVAAGGAEKIKARIAEMDAEMGARFGNREEASSVPG